MADGRVRLRSNVVNAGNAWHLVPGEVVAIHRRDLLSRHSRPKQLQVDERMYYVPCGVCDRLINVIMRDGCDKCSHGPTPKQLAEAREAHRQGLEAVAAARQKLEDELGVERDA